MIGYQSLISLFIGGILLPETFAYSSTYYQYKRSSVDSGSYSNIEVARMNHFELITAVNFDKQQIEGLQTIFFDAIQDVSELVLDIQGLNISRCTYQIPNPSDPTKPGFFEANYDIFADTKMNTNGLIIYMTDKLFKGSKFSVQITYTTRNDSVSVNWLKPEQTASKTLPYMYSKCTAIHCRSLAPLQDSPSVKVTYAGAVSVKDMFRANMSAPYVSEESNTPGYMTYHFQTYNFIPPYLLALAVGNLTSKSVGYRTNVISEPNVIDDYAEVFSGLESILNETEKYMTPVPYLWGNYTVLVQPPSFPVGGMENPLLTFVSPSIMQKDKSQVFVAAHEIAHSWSGNLVTQRDWHNLWINEGMTVFIERKVSSRIHSPDFAKIENYLGNLTVWDDINSFGKDSQDSSLYPTIGNNPDSSYSQLPYEKGNQFMDYLEIVLNQNGSNTTDNMQLFLSSFIGRFKYQSVNYLDVRLYFNQFVKATFAEKDVDGIIKSVDWDKWITKGGDNPYKLDFKTDEAATYQKLADDYVVLDGTDKSPDNFSSYNKEENLNLKVIFQQQLLSRMNDLTIRTLIKIDADLNCTLDENPEIGQRWFPLAIQLDFDDAFDKAFDYVSKWGRQKYILPVYTALVRSGMRSTALKWYKANESFYHPIAAANIRKIILSSMEFIEAEDTQLISVKSFDK